MVATALAFGLILLALASTLGAISGCHVNPAVTLGCLLTGRMRLREATSYCAAQLSGATTGAAVLYAIVSSTPHYTRATTGLGTDGYGAHSMAGLGAGGAFVTEVVLTFIFLIVVLAATSRVGSPRTAGLAIGLALTGGRG